MQPPPAPPPPAPKFVPDYAAMGRAGWQKRPLVTVQCRFCGKERQTRVPKATKWCGNSCNWQAHREAGAYDREMTCIVCEAKFNGRPNKGKRLRETCSADCRNNIVGHKNAKITDEQVPLIRQAHRNGQSQRSIAKEYKVSQNVISGIIQGRSFKWVPEPSTKEQGTDVASSGALQPTPWSEASAHATAQAPTSNL